MKLDQVRRMATKLPDVTEEPHFAYSSFRVRGKIFVTVPPGDEYLHVFVGEAERELALALHPDFIGKLHWGQRVAGLRITLAAARPAVVDKLLRQAWTNKAPKSVRAAVQDL